MLTAKALAAACRNGAIRLPVKKVRGKETFTVCLEGSPDRFSFFCKKSEKDIQVTYRGDREDFLLPRHEDRQYSLPLDGTDRDVVFREELYELIFSRARHMFLLWGCDMSGKLYGDDSGYLHAGSPGGPVLFRYHSPAMDDGSDIPNLYENFIWKLPSPHALRRTLNHLRLTVGDVCDAYGRRKSERKAFLAEDAARETGDKTPHVWMNAAHPVKSCSPGDIFDIVYGKDRRVRVMVVGGEHDYLSGRVHCCLVNDQCGKLFLQADERRLPDDGCVEFWNYGDLPLAALHPCESRQSLSVREAAKALGARITAPLWADMPILPHESLVLEFRRMEHAFFKQLRAGADMCAERQMSLAV